MVSFIIVTWNSERDITRCLDSLAALSQAQDGYEVIVVDNASTDSTRELIITKYPTTRLIINSENLGFARACNQGARFARGQYLWFLNPDAFLSKVNLETIPCFFQLHPKASVLGTRLEFTDGMLQPSCRMFPTPLIAVLLLLKLHQLIPNLPTFRRYFYLDWSHDLERRVEQVMGASLIVPQNRFMSLGGFDEQFWPLLFEEVDLCRRVYAQGNEVWFTPELVVGHTKGTAMTKVPTLKRQQNLNRQLKRYMKKWYGWPGATLVSIFTPLSLVLTVFISVVVRIVPLRSNRKL